MEWLLQLLWLFFKLFWTLKDRRLYKIFSISCCFWFMTGVGLIIILFQIFPFAGWHLQNYYKSYSGYW
jgi:hypothetical protein